MKALTFFAVQDTSNLLTARRALPGALFWKTYIARDA